MKSDEIAIENISEVKTVILSSPRKGQVINTASEGAQASGSSNSSDSSPSDLRRRLQDLPSPDEFDLVADRVAALGRRICRKRELFLRLQGVAGRIEEKDEWEDRESTGSGSSLTRVKDARARRRARARLSESSSDCENKAMVISQAGKSDPNESSVDRSRRDNDYLPAIEMSRRQYRSFSASEPCSTRLSHQNRDGPNEIRTNRFRNFTSRDHASKSADLPPSVAPFSISKIRPKKFGGYRPSSGVVVKNLSSESESESANETTRAPARKVDDATATELSSPGSKVVTVNGPVKKMPIMSARSDITESILPNLLPSARSYHDLDRPVLQETDPRNYAAERTSDEREKASQDVLLFSARSFTSDSEELMTNICDEKMRIKDKVRRAISELEDKLRACNENERFESFAPRTHDNQDLNPPTNRSDLEGDYSENIRDDVHDEQSENIYAEEVENAPRLLEGKMKNDATEDALSQGSEAFESEDHSRSSCAAKYLQKQFTSSGRSKNGGADLLDKRDREINRAINVPTLALDSQDISYSTSAGSRECSVTQPLDPHALIKALSTVSLKQNEGNGDVSRKLEHFSRNNTIDTSDFPARGETWRVPRSSRTELSIKSLSRAPSRIPVRISSSNNLSANGANKHSGFYEQSEYSHAVTNDEKAKFTDRNEIQKKRIVARCQRSEVELLYSQTREQDSSLESNDDANENVAASDEEMEFEANGYKPRGLTFSNRRSATYGDCTREKTQRSSETGFGADCKKSCPPVFFTKPTYSDNHHHQDYAKIDARSSNRSTSRESARMSANVTSATESPCLSRYKKNVESCYVESSSRNIEENFTWRTEDECASIRDEENPQDVEYEQVHRGSRDESEELHSPTIDRFRVSMEGLSNLHKSGIEKVAKRQRRIDDDLEFNENRSSRDRTPESTKIAQSENLTSQVHKTQEICSLIAKMSSSWLNYEQKRKKKSQERFPFTISEASGVFSTEQKNTCDCRESLDNKKNCPADVQLEEKTVHRLTTHPSITRLAVSGLTETMGEILSCAMQQEKEATSSKSKIRALMRMFSSKARKKTKQQTNRSKSSFEATEIIYKNRACQADSRANSCSGDSITHGTSSMNDDTGNNHWIDYDVTRYQVTRSNPTLVSSGNALRKTESLEAIAQEHPRRRYDRDDLWVRDPPSEEKINETRENEKNNPRESPSDDRYSISFAKNIEPDGQSESKNSPKDQHDATSTRALLSDEKSKQIPSNFVSDEEDEDVTGCFCLKLCRLFTSSSKNRSSAKEQVPLSSRAENSASPLQKRKK